MTTVSLHRLLISNPTGWDRTGLTFTNVGSAACFLAGFPIIALHDQDGPIQFVYRHVGNPPRVVLLPRGSAFVMFGKFRCDLGERRTATTGQVWLKAHAEARAEFPMHVGVELCKPGIGSEGHTVTVTPFEPTLRAAYLHFFSHP